MLKQIRMLVIFLMGLMMAGCGGGSGANGGNVNGTWKATLTNSDGTPAYSFTTAFTQNGDGSLTITNLSFTTAGPCLASKSTNQTGTFALSGNFNGNVAGTFGMTITTDTSGAPTQNVLTLQGSVNGNTISGTWNLTGESGCSGKGNFVFTRI